MIPSGQREDEASTGWSRSRPIFCVLHTSGPDPLSDQLLGLHAWQAGDAEPLELSCALETGPSSDDAREAAAGAAWSRLLERLADSAVVVHEAAAFEDWARHLTALARDGLSSTPPTLGLDQLTALFLPGHALPQPPADAALLRESCELLLGKIRALPEATRRLASYGNARAALTLSAYDEFGAARIVRALDFLAHPELWAVQEAEGAAPWLGLEELVEVADAGLARKLSKGLTPSYAQTYLDEWAQLEKLAPRIDGLMRFPAEDHELLEQVFEQHLPAELAGPGEAPRAPRPAQVEVAREVARTLGAREGGGSGELLLVHAPTGTGKTLAYLFPLLLWTARHRLRAAVATYTRALQAQGMDREVPRALRTLDRAGAFAAEDDADPQRPRPRVTLLKGRENYLCWRAWRVAARPGDDAEGEEWLAWTSLALFAVTDPEGDLDRFPTRPPVELASGKRFRTRAQNLAREVRAKSACCKTKEDKLRCGADLARRRAERAHVVLTNHALALSSQDFFHHIVFDECEHLHDVAHNAWSTRFSFMDARELLVHLHDGSDDHGSPSPLARIERQLEGDERGGLLAGDATEGTRSVRDALNPTLDAWEALRRACAELERGAKAFVRWRDGAEAERGPVPGSSWLEAWLEEPGGARLADARRTVGLAGNALDACLAELAEGLERAPLTDVPRLRRALELARAELGELMGSLESWMPLRHLAAEALDAIAREEAAERRAEEPEAAPDRRSAADPEEPWESADDEWNEDAEQAPREIDHTFRDIERDERGNLTLSARVLLPNEYLGRHYHPALGTGIFLSATTWLSGGFEAALGFLGLDRAASPASDEERGPCEVRTYRAGEVFDYSNVLVSIPTDTPQVRSKDEFLAWTRRFLLDLADTSRGRVLALFTNAADVRRLGEELAGAFRARSLPLYWQGMPGATKEELSRMFRERVDATLLGVDTFWYGADFPGETLEYLVLGRIPYGVPDRYHEAQCAAIGRDEQRKRIYMPRALAKFRQGFGRLLRTADDRGAVFIIDGRVLDPRHRAFLKELPVRSPFTEGDPERSSRLVRDSGRACLRAAFEHMGVDASSLSPHEDGAEELSSFDLPRRGRGEEVSADPDQRSGGDEGRGDPAAGEISTDELPF